MAVSRRCVLVLPLAAALARAEYRIDIEHPRLLLPQRRLRLLRRESERESLRWNQFNTLMRAAAPMPERGFALALYYIVSGAQAQGRAAIEWALGAANTDLRQISLVFDWCQPLLSPEESSRLVTKIRQLLAKAPRATIADRRSRVLAAIAVAGHADGVASPVIEETIEKWWASEIAPKLNSGDLVIPPSEHFPLLEMFHVLRDCVDVDLREAAAKYFATLPVYHILSHYPAPFPAAENEYRIPVMDAHREPNLREAALSRAAALAIVAFDNNAQESQFLQGWLIQDRFLMLGTFGCPYEFLWANPYQPGLSFHYLPNLFHDERNGRLIIRSSWEDDATWFYQAEGRRQLFRNGEIINLKQDAFDKPMTVGNTTLLTPDATGRWQIEHEEPHRYFLFGLKPNAKYELEVDDEEMREVETDRGGVLELVFAANRRAGALLRAVR
jgi:hypothetical protein